jgi:hypothetical protein
MRRFAKASLGLTHGQTTYADDAGADGGLAVKKGGVKVLLTAG